MSASRGTLDGVEDFMIVRGADRFVSRGPGTTSRHSFSFGRHYDPGNIGFGLLVLNNDDVVQPGSGYETHPHRDVEIVTWVLDGALAHRDSTGAGGVIYPGLAQRLSAGRGVQHSEFNDAPIQSSRGGRRTGQPDSELRFIQMWVLPDHSGGEPVYEQRDVSAEVVAGRLVTVASGMPRHRDVAAVGLAQSAAAMHVAQLTAGGAATLPSAPFVHLYVTRGTVDVEGIGRLDEGDAVRIVDEGGRQVLSVPDAEVIVWEMHTDVHTTPR